jgi:hypothetical protein
MNSFTRIVLSASFTLLGTACAADAGSVSPVETTSTSTVTVSEASTATGTGSATNTVTTIAMGTATGSETSTATGRETSTATGSDTDTGTGSSTATTTASATETMTENDAGSMGAAPVYLETGAVEQSPGVYLQVVSTEVTADCGAIAAYFTRQQPGMPTIDCAQTGVCSTSCSARPFNQNSNPISSGALLPGGYSGVMCYFCL